MGRCLIKRLRSSVRRANVAADGKLTISGEIVTTPMPPGWYPDPSGSGQQRYFDGNAWGPFAPLAPPPVAQKVREPNPLFTVLAVLSAIPTAFFGLVYLAGSQSNIAGLLLIWSFMWTWVWWKMRSR